ncbi:MAG TPA: hypothetical protein PKE55_14210 [Kiritimatiellia bacterium]|nr:hypothetical protein [Kiritimatiellia bacterium]
MCARGGGGARLMRPGGGAWTRTEVGRWVADLAREEGPVLAGFDFGMGLPFVDRGGYFPGWRGAPRSAVDLWRMVDELAGGGEDGYGGEAVRPGSRLHGYFNTPWGQGEGFENRLRRTEEVCRELWTRPSGVFNCVGPGSVGLGSLAGMRFLHGLRKVEGVKVAVWPFDDPRGADLVVVEIFPRLYAMQAGCDPRRWRERGFLGKAAQGLGSEAPKLRGVKRTEDVVDALVSAMAMRRLAERRELWGRREEFGEAAKVEGWIFGV